MQISFFMSLFTLKRLNGLNIGNNDGKSITGPIRKVEQYQAQKHSSGHISLDKRPQVVCKCFPFFMFLLNVFTKIVSCFPL